VIYRELPKLVEILALGVLGLESSA